jgi:hypothetical protein
MADASLSDPAATASPSPLPAPEPEHATGSIHTALLQFHRQVGPIFKGSQAKYGKFADLSTVLEAITPPLLEAGLVLTQTITPSEDDGGQLLITTLTHAASAQQLCSRLPIPCLDQLLARHHQLRLEVLQRHPLDLNLAANAQLPLTLPRLPQPAAGAAAAENASPPEATAFPLPAAQSAPPQRPPGLRLDDQLKGIGGLLALLGLNSNPLHAIGGVVTYLRRYAILSLLCLATEDGDGAEPAASSGSTGSAQAARPQPAPSPSPSPATATAPATTSRSRRSRSSSSSTSGSNGTSSASAAAAGADPPAPALAPAPTAAEQGSPVRAAAPQPASPKPDSPQAEAATATAATAASTNQLTPAEIQQLIAEIRTLPNEKVAQLVESFRQHFQLPAGVLISDYLSSHEHLGFCRSFIAAHRQPAGVAA